MMYLWFCCALLATEAVPESRITFVVELEPLPAGLRLEREPRALVLQRDGVRIHRLALPVIPKKAQRKDDHAFLAMGLQGLWIVRLLPEGRIFVVARHRLPKPVDGFFFEGNRVVPTSAGRPVALLPPPEPVPPAVAPPSHETSIWPVKDRRQVIPADQLRSMLDWPVPEELAPPVSVRPKAFLESNFLQTLGLPSTTIEHDLGHTAELLLRVGYHLTPNHVVGVGFWFMANDYQYHHPKGDGFFYTVGDYGNPIYFFYRYSFTSRPIEMQIEPLLGHVYDSATEELQETWGFRVAGQWVKRGGPMRFGIEARLDVFWKLVFPTVALIYGINF